MHGILASIFHKNSEPPEGQLITAAEAGKLWRVKRLLKQGVDVNGKNRTCRTALSAAAAKGHDKVVDALLKAGADTEAGHDIMGRAALSLAAEAGHGKVVRRLLAAKAGVDAVSSSGTTALHGALMYYRRDIATALIEAGANMSLPDSSQTAPLHMAVIFCPDIAVVMVRKGADISLRDGEGRTALDRAQECGLDDVVAAISERSARDEEARRAVTEKSAQEARDKEAAMSRASTLQRDIAVGKPIVLKSH
jgi:uncharacterized protein